LKNSMTGQMIWPIATYQPITDSLGRALADEAYPLQLITSRTILMTKSRTVSNYWLLHLLPENYLELHPSDAARLGLRDGQKVRVVSPTNPEGVWEVAEGVKVPIVGKVKVTELIRPGLVTFYIGWGHWDYGASAVEIDGKRIAGDGRRAAGINANAVMRLDPVVKHTTLSDVIGGSAVFYDTRVRLLPEP
ncbi:MAG: hypothetical protein NZ869_08465, partial [Thermoanaerobaculum sp.]|nr:hypothetical protein [Thermoanaerobaculum sp.]